MRSSLRRTIPHTEGYFTIVTTCAGNLCWEEYIMWQLVEFSHNAQQVEKGSHSSMNGVNLEAAHARTLSKVQHDIYGG